MRNYEKLGPFVLYGLVRAVSNCSSPKPFSAPCCAVTLVMSDSVRRYGLQPARLLCPRDSPSKNTGVSAIPRSSDPGIKPVPLKSPALAGGFFTTSTTGEAPNPFQTLLILAPERLSETKFSQPLSY